MSADFTMTTPTSTMPTPSPFNRDMAEPSQPSNAELIEDPETMTKKPIETSVEELQRQKEDLDRQIAERLKAEKLAVIQQIVDVATQYEVTIEDLIEAMGGFKPKRKGVKATPKYRDPATGVTWSGRGKEPTWMRGRDRDDFLIKEDEADED